MEATAPMPVATPRGAAATAAGGPAARGGEGGRVPGDGRPLTAVHPSYDLHRARPASFHPKVGGIDFLPDGRMLVSCWEPRGGVYLLEGWDGEDPEAIQVTVAAEGLAEPLGLVEVAAGLGDEP